MPRPGVGNVLRVPAAVLIAALASLTVLISLVALVAPLAPAAQARSATAPSAPAPAPSGRVVIIGVPALRWSDLDAAGTPALWALAGRGAAGALSVRTTTAATCPVDGWLTLSAGQRARLAHGSCALPPAPTPAGAAVYVPGFEAMRRDNANTAYEARLGLLGDAVQRGGGCTLAVGPGGVFGAADTAGRVDRYVASVDRVTDWSQCALTIVDVDSVFRAYINAGVDARGAQVPLSNDERAAAATRADQQVGRVLSRLPAGTTVLVAGLSDTGGTAHLRVALAATAPASPAAGAASGAPPRTAAGTTWSGYLTSNATRRSGLVTLTDLTSTALRELGLRRPDAAIGAPWRARPAGATTAEKREALDDEDVAARSVSKLQAPFFILLFGAQLLLYGFASVVLRRRRANGRSRVLAATRMVALAAAAAPVASYLANVVPWWRSAHPAPTLMMCVLTAMASVTALALAGPWRRSPIAPALVIAGVTALVLGLDVLTGSHLQLNSLMGYTALVGGRYYGFGNIAFAVFATSAILAAAWLAEWPLRAGRRAAAVALVIAAGLATAALDGWPAWGSDFGGVLAIVPGTAVLAFLLAGRRISPLTMGAIAVVAVGAVLAIAFADSLRGATEQTHLGRFWDQLLDGTAWGVIGRKVVAMLYSLRYWQFTVIAVGALCFLFLVLARPLRWRAAVLADAYARVPTLRPALISALTTAVVGMLVNDSGVVVAAIALGLAVPLTLAAGIQALPRPAGPPAAAAAAPPPGRPEHPKSRSAPTGLSSAAPQ
ncbi:MAG TPA: hypothetical protein VFU43_10190 [Streptosporangiaceae bacterium]|nr:hypothetical protein [Streptosporangiaceae bacterium]